MTTFLQNIDIYVALVLILSAIVLFIFPPKFGNIFYGFSTKDTVKNEIIWAYGQKLFSVSLFITGIILGIIGYSKLLREIPPFRMVLLLIALSAFSKYLVHIILAKKYPNI